MAKVKLLGGKIWRRDATTGQKKGKDGKFPVKIFNVRWSAWCLGRNFR